MWPPLPQMTDAEGINVVLESVRRRQFKIPSTFVSIDCETTNVLVKDNQSGPVSIRLPVQVVFRYVQDWVSVQARAYYLNWGIGTDITPAEFAHAIQQVHFLMASKQDEFPFTYDNICARGIPAKQSLAQIRVEIENCISNKWFVLGHNLLGFDIPMLNVIFHRYLSGYTPDWDAVDIFDTGAFEKALLLGAYWYQEEHLTDWQLRVLEKERGVKWGLKTCIERYNLDLSDAVGIQHDAEYDTLVVVRLAQMYSRMLG